MGMQEEFWKEWGRIAQSKGITTERYISQQKILTKEESGFSFILNYNQWKINRPSPKKEAVAESCPFDNEIEAWQNGEDIMIFGDRYEPYYITPNLFPGEKGHSIIMHEEHSKVSYRPSKQDLETFIEVSRDTGYLVQINIEGSGATLPTHNHAHLRPVKFPAQNLKREELEPELEQIADYPFANLVFTGENSAANAARFLQSHKHVYGLVIDGDEITYVPFKKYWAKGFSVSEAMGYFFMNSREEFDEDYNYFFDRISSTVPQKV